MRKFLTITLLVLVQPALAMEDFVLEDEVALCSGCHGEAGLPAEADYPIIWGQEYFYIYTQLKDYKAGRREHEIMTDIAAEYSRDQMKQLAQYFSDQPWPAIVSTTEESDQGLADRGIAAGQCSACHGKWQGDSRIPRLAGQLPGYLERTMFDFKTDVRMNAPDLNSTMRQLDDQTISALARYLAGL